MNGWIDLQMVKYKKKRMRSRPLMELNPAKAYARRLFKKKVHGIIERPTRVIPAEFVEDQPQSFRNWPLLSVKAVQIRC